MVSKVMLNAQSPDEYCIVTDILVFHRRSDAFYVHRLVQRISFRFTLLIIFNFLVASTLCASPYLSLRLVLDVALFGRPSPRRCYFMSFCV